MSDLSAKRRQECARTIPDPASGIRSATIISHFPSDYKRKIRSVQNPILFVKNHSFRNTASQSNQAGWLDFSPILCYPIHVPPEQYRRLTDHIAAHQLKICGFSREITMIDYGITNDTEKFVTEISIPVSPQP